MQATRSACEAAAVPGIYLRQGETYVSMTETPFEREDLLQALIAQHPEILADDEAGRGRLMLVRREAAVSDQEDGGGRWSLDHLYLDRDGVPTLVEVKRSSDTRGRREVVAQMLDYAANAKASFGSDRMVAWLDDEARARGTTAAKCCQTRWASRILMGTGQASPRISTPNACD